MVLLISWSESSLFLRAGGLRAGAVGGGVHSQLRKPRAAPHFRPSLPAKLCSSPVTPVWARGSC